MINIDKVLKIAKEKDASDVHLIYKLKPMLRIARDLIPIEEYDELTEEDLSEIYDYFIRGNLEKDETFKTKKRLDRYNRPKKLTNISLT